ncbi:MAG: ScyD/ScyE family protein [Bryobacteraceae bacterium]
MYRSTRIVLFAAVTAAGVIAQAPPRVVAAGLQAPQKLALTAGGNFLVTEGGEKPNEGRVSIVTRAGARRSLIEGLPTGVSPEGEASGPTGIALRGRTLYVAIGVGDAEVDGPRPGSAVFSPKGPSSPLFSSVLVFELSGDADAASAPFRMTPAQHMALAVGDEIELDNGAGANARASMLVNFVDAIPDPGAIYRFSNPWGIEVSADGNTLWVADASMDVVWRVDTRTGRPRMAGALPRQNNPTPVGGPIIDSVPTAVHSCGGELLVSQLTGFPFLSNAARIHALDTERRTFAPFIANLSLVTDFACTGSSELFVLEMSGNFLAQPPAPGRLLRYSSPQPTVVSNAVILPVGLAYDEARRSVYVLELTGRLLEFALN